MKVSVADIGSNSVRFSVYSIVNGKFEYLVDKRYMVGLAGYIKDGRMSDEGVIVLCDTMADINDIINELSPDESHFIATACLRNIQNSHEVIATVLERTSTQITIISGDEEADYSFLAASLDQGDVTQKIGLVVDIGGGSTELVYYSSNERRILYSESFAVGSLVLHERFSKMPFLSILSLESSYLYTDEIIKTRENTPIDCIIGVGGSCRALKNIVTHEYPKYINDGRIDLNIIDLLIDHVIYHTPQECEDFIAKYEPHRVKTFYTGLIILGTIKHKTKARTLLVSEYGVKEGLLLKKYL